MSEAPRTRSSERKRTGRNAPRRSTKERPDYYITPTRDFTRYTRDYEEKYWSRETALAWDQDVTENLRRHIDSLSARELSRLAHFSLGMVIDDIDAHVEEIARVGLPSGRDALRGIAECVPNDLGAIGEALRLQEPLEHLELPVAALRDRLAILHAELVDLREQKRLGLFRDGATVRRIDGQAERAAQRNRLSNLESEIGGVRAALRDRQGETSAERTRLSQELADGLGAITPRVIDDLQQTRALVEGALECELLPEVGAVGTRIRDLIFARQLRGVKDIANHALVAEQSAIAPLTMGIIHYRRQREIQEAMTTFVNDEAKHTAVFRRYMAEKLQARERIPEYMIKGSDVYMLIARMMPSAAVFLAVIVETIGAAFLDFFGREEHMPEPLFRSICWTIAEKDERRHLDLCSDLYNELYRTGSRWERWRNRHALDQMMRKAYGDKSVDHPIMRACRSFGVDPNDLYRWIAEALSRELARVGVYLSSEGYIDLFPT
jgi:hypothetical protein